MATSHISSILKSWNLPHGLPPFLRPPVVANLPLLGPEVGCFYEGELVVVASLPGLGKTAFLAWLSLNISKTQSLLWIPCNASAEFATMRFLLSSSGKSFEWMEELNSDALLDAMLQLRNYQLFISEGTTMDTSTLEAEICNQVEKNGIRVVVIDDLASYGPARSGTALQKYANNIAKALKQLAEKLRIVVFLTSQIERKIDRYQGILQLMPRHIQYILFGAPEVDRIIGLSRLSYHGIDYDEEGNVVQNQIRLDMLRNKSGELTSVELLYNQRMSSFLESPKPF